jgi:predicted  nucleic acid-binding Zn-ribbon protein
MQREQVSSRIASLKKEFEAGQNRLRELETELTQVRDTMLRISGAIQVLEELSIEARAGGEAEGAPIGGGTTG